MRIVALLLLLLAAMEPNSWAQEADTQSDPRNNIANPGQQAILDKLRVRSDDYRVDGDGNVVELRIVHIKMYRITEEHLDAVLRLEHLIELELTGVNLVDQDAERIVEALPNLESLVLRRNFLQAPGIRAIAGLKRLKKLNLSSSNVTDQALVALPPKLVELNLGGTAISSSSLPLIAEQTEMEVLKLNSTCCQCGIDAFQQMTNLQHLGFYKKMPDQESIVPAYIHAFRLLVDQQGRSVDEAIKILGLSNSVDSKGKVTSLVLSSNDWLPGFDDELVPYLNRLQGLKELRVYNAGLTGNGLAEIDLYSELETCAVTGSPKPEFIKKICNSNTIKHLTLPASTTNDAMDYVARMKQLESLDLSGSKVGGKGIAKLLALQDLTSLSLSNSRAKSQALRYLPEFANLTEVTLNGLEIGDRSMHSVGLCKKLQILKIANTRVSDQGVSHLYALHSLRQLDSSGTRVSAEGRLRLFAEIGLTASEILEVEGVEFRKLDSGLRLTFTKAQPGLFSDAHCKLARKVPGVSEIRFYRVPVTATGLRMLAQAKGLNTLYLYQCNELKDSAIAAISQMKDLESLQITRCKQVSPESVSGLARMKQLRQLNLALKVDDNTINKLRVALPNCEIRSR